MAKNEYLKRREAMNQGFLEVGMDTGFQKCWDLLQIVLHDREVMGKDIFGKERIKKIFLSMKDLEKEMCNAWLPTQEKDADVCQRDLDAMLKEIWGEDLVTFYERYPYIKKPDYKKGHKGWRN